MTEATQPEAKGLTSEEVGLFHEQGYLKIGKLLDDDLVDLLRQEYDALFSEAQRDGRYRNLAIDDTDSVEEKRKAPEQMLQIMQMCERSIHFRKLLFQDSILDMIESLLGPNLQLFHDQALFKPAHHGGAVFWHQDNAYWKCKPANLVSCWMTLDDVDVTNGAMHLIPGSHRKAVSHDRSESTGALLDLGDKVNEAAASVIDLPAGGALIHHCQTLHYSPPNTTSRQRRAFIIHYMTPGTKNVHKEQNIGVSFAHPMLRMRM